MFLKPRMKPRRASLLVFYKNRAFEVASLGSDVEGGDFYYHFKYPQDFEDWGINFATERLGYRPDHISFHRDGSVHITPKGKNKQRILLCKAYEPLLGCPSTTITPLLIDCIYPQVDGWELPQAKGASARGEGWSFVDLENFSVMLFLIHKSRSVRELNSLGLGMLWKPYTLILNFEAFQDWSIIALLSNYVFPRLDPVIISQDAPVRFRGSVHRVGRISEMRDLHIHFNRLINPAAHHLLLH